MVKRVLVFCLTIIMSLSLGFSKSKSIPSNDFSYLKIVEDLKDGQLKKDMTLTRKEVSVLKKYAKGKKQSTRNLKFLVSAIGKHRCISAPKTPHKLKKWPLKADVATWFEFDSRGCDKVSTKPGKKPNLPKPKPSTKKKVGSPK